MTWAERPDALLQISGRTNNLEIYLPYFRLEPVPFWNIFHEWEEKYRYNDIFYNFYGKLLTRNRNLNSLLLKFTYLAVKVQESGI